MDEKSLRTRPGWCVVTLWVELELEALLKSKRFTNKAANTPRLGQRASLQLGPAFAATRVCLWTGNTTPWNPSSQSVSLETWNTQLGSSRECLLSDDIAVNIVWKSGRWSLKVWFRLNYSFFHFIVNYRQWSNLTLNCLMDCAICHGRKLLESSAFLVCFDSSVSYSFPAVNTILIILKINVISN